eukprot:scaffold17121_cov122-Isochrysis_galbana.AAC.8
MMVQWAGAGFSKPVSSSSSSGLVSKEYSSTHTPQMQVHNELVPARGAAHRAWPAWCAQPHAAVRPGAHHTSQLSSHKQSRMSASPACPRSPATSARSPAAASRRPESSMANSSVLRMWRAPRICASAAAEKNCCAFKHTRGWGWESLGVGACECQRELRACLALLMRKLALIRLSRPPEALIGQDAARKLADRPYKLGCNLGRRRRHAAGIQSAVQLPPVGVEVGRNGWTDDGKPGGAERRHHQGQRRPGTEGRRAHRHQSGLISAKLQKSGVPFWEFSFGASWAAERQRSRDEMGRLLLLSLPALAAAYGPSALSPRTRHASSRSAAIHMTSATAFDLAVSKAPPPQLQRAAAAASRTHMQPGRAANARASPRARELRPDFHARRRRDCSCCHPRATCAWPLRSDGTG